jgi:hypothetical protein
MTFESEQPGDEPKQDDAATEAPATEPPESPHEQHDGESEEPGGPYGNPHVDEESLRKHQEESSERS